MIKTDYHGARGSNAGDDFHELWTLRQALTLLDQNTDLRVVTVEGLRAEDEKGTPKDTWNGVDCTFYYGGDTVASANYVVIDQVKYSAANPDQMWTLARLTHSTNRKRDNSVIGRLAKAFVGLNIKRPDLTASGKILCRLVSNQQVDSDVVSGLQVKDAARQSIRAELRKASKLNVKDFEAFATTLNFSQCGSGSRFALGDNVLAILSEWTDDDARTSLNYLLRYVQRLMLPEGKGEVITRESILISLGFSDLGALFPCPSAIQKVEKLIPRDVSQKVLEKMSNGDQHICLYGEAGCGKTTALQGLVSLLPAGSATVVFDCYGGGRYLDSDAYRHRGADAFLQLSNELASRLRIPFLLCQSKDHDYAKAFKKRLDKAAEVVASTSRSALLVVVVDAADNSVTAASTQSPPERSFVQDFVSMSQLPNNVRFIVTARTGRLPTLKLPTSFILMAMTGFTREETAAHVRGIWNDAPGTWIDDIHHLTHGNPRVQWYALDYAGDDPARALDYLRPSGKNLGQIFKEQLAHAYQKLGSNQDIKNFCSGIIALPRPIPITNLSTVTGMTKAHINDLCADLAPGIRLINELISFADEDFEHFVRGEADDQLVSIQAKIADHFADRHKVDAYAATHLASALFNAGRRQKIIDLINIGDEAAAISDPVMRRSVHLQRLRIAMKVCKETGNNTDAVLTLLRGAEALKTDDIIRRMLKENPDIAANFARKTYGAIILRDPQEIENHGPLLFQLTAVDARKEDSISVREGHRQIGAWLKRRSIYLEEAKRNHPNQTPENWNVTYLDIAAETEAIVRISGPKSAIDYIQKWRPKSLVSKVATILSYRLITMGEGHLIESCVTEAGISVLWDLFLLIPLALSGKDIDLSRIKSILADLLRRRRIRLDTLKGAWQDDNSTAEYLETILTACELVAARSSDRSGIVPILKKLVHPSSRRCDHLFSSEDVKIDVSLRAYALLERIANRKMTIGKYLVDPPEPEEVLSSEKAEKLKRVNNEKKEGLKSFIGPLVDVYDIRAQILLGLIKSEDTDLSLGKAVTSFQDNSYAFDREHSALAMRTRIALSITRLMVVPGINREVLMEHALTLSVSRSNTYRTTNVSILANLALDRSLHEKILKRAATQTDIIKGAKTSADDKISDLVHFARLLLPISYEDSKSIANDAICAAAEINEEALYEIRLLPQLAEYAVKSMDIKERRRVACNISTVVDDAGTRINSGRDFPWESVAQALTTLDVCLALAATARWEDSSLIDRTTLLPPIFKTALSRHEMVPAQIAALTPLLDYLSVELISQIIEETISQGVILNQKILAEHLAREELLRFGGGSRLLVTEKLRLLSSEGDPGYWTGRLVSANAFHQEIMAEEESVLSNKRGETQQDNLGPELQDLVSNINWSAHRFIVAEDIYQVIDFIRASAQTSRAYVSNAEILDRIGGSVAPDDRVSHLEALSHSKSPRTADYALVEAIARRVSDWYDVPSVANWRRERLLQVVVDRLPSFSRGLAQGQSVLPALLEKSGMPPERICATLLDAMELHVDELDAPIIYALVGLVAKYCTSDESSLIISRHTDRLLERIPAAERDQWEISDIPTEITEGIGRFLYALMGDIDVRIRWRAAHAVRCLANFGDIKSIDKLVSLFDRTTEVSYRTSDAPFYWLSARLWLMMTLDRIAHDVPSAIRHHGSRLIEIATSDKFPHVLVRSFAKSAVHNLAANNNLMLDLIQRKSLEGVNRSSMRRKKARQPFNASFKESCRQAREDRSFHFDTMDTIPYWYSSRLKIFADVSMEDFLDTAEHWIVDSWGVRTNPWRWDEEPRKHRFSNHPFLSLDHSHGSMPTLERFHTYLEWHAMWCTIGELMQTRALSKSSTDDYYTLERQLDRAGLTAPPLWLADINGPKPLEHQFWIRVTPSDNINSWVDNVNNDKFLAELGLANRDGTVIVASSHETGSCKFSSSVMVRTALVSPRTAASLTRALQTVQDSWDYRIPPEGDELEICKPPFKLLGWLDNSPHELGIDERDPLRYDVDGVEHVPSQNIITSLNLKPIYYYPVRWIEADGGNTTFIYEAWGACRDEERPDMRQYDESVRSSGWRLKIDSQALTAFLNGIGYDLIVEIEITRRNRGYGNFRRYNEESEKEARFDRVILLRRDGTIEDADGCFGTWAVPRP